MRIQADGRNIKDPTINPKFASFAETLYLTENQARKEVEERNKIREGHNIVMAMKNEEQIRKDATLARAEKSKLLASTISKLGSVRDKQTVGNKRDR